MLYYFQTQKFYSSASLVKNNVSSQRKGPHKGVMSYKQSTHVQITKINYVDPEPHESA